MSFFPQPSQVPQVPQNPPAGAVVPVGDPLAPSAEEAIHILIVDDEPKNLTVLETVLDDPAYQLIRAGSADEALTALVAQDFALLILDVQMPGMTGFELAQIVKQVKRTASVPIIFLTAYYSEDQHVLEGYGSGAVDYLHKPVNPPILRSKVAVFAELHRKTRKSELAGRALLAEVTERRRAEEQLRELNENLERIVAERTDNLSKANQALSKSETQLRAAVDALRDGEQRLELALAGAELGAWDWDVLTGSVCFDRRWAEMLGFAPNEVESHYGFWEERIHPEDLPQVRLILADHFAGRTPSYRAEHRILHRGGAWMWVLTCGRVMERSKLGAPVRACGTQQDITERKRAEEALRRTDKRKNEFLAMLGHELRNPLGAIRHAVDVENDAPADPATRLWARDVIARKSLQLSRMVDDLLDVARIERGRIELRREVLDLRAVINRAVASVRPLIEQKNHRVALAVGAEELPVNGDAVRLEQVFVNLLNNAAKYTAHSGHISVEALREDSMTVVSIHDTGVGLSAEMVTQVFDLFTQADTSLDRSEGGLGIGLTVVKTLVENHGGSIDARSNGPGCGSTFTVRLPLSSSAAIENSQPAAPRDPATSEVTIRVLIVDDNCDAADGLARILIRRGCEVRTAYNGRAGLELAHHFNPQVLLLDLGLPEIDGYEVCRQLRADPRFQPARILAISGYAQESDVERSRAAGFDEHFAKPVDLAKLLGYLRSAVTN